MYAAWSNGNPAVVTALLSAGADGTAQSAAGRNAFEYGQSNPALSGGQVLSALEAAAK